MQVKMTTQEHRNSGTETLVVPFTHAYKMGTKGGFWRVTAVSLETDEVLRQWEVNN